MLNKITNLYFTILPFITFITSFTPLILHGHIKKGMSKNFFIFFYINCLIFNFFIKNFNLYLLHILRRAIECLIFRYNHSKMNYIQFIHGIIYYIFLSLHLRDIEGINLPVFILLNVFQTLTHILVFRYKRFVYSHYFSEFLIYLYLFYIKKSKELFYNTIYLIIFILTSIINRNKKYL